LTELVTTFFAGCSDLARHLSAFCELIRGFSPKPVKSGERIQRLDRPDNFEKSNPPKINREDHKDRKENIYVGFVVTVHARSCAGSHP